MDQGSVQPRPAYGHHQAGRDALEQVLWRIAVSCDSHPLRMGVRDGHTRDRPETHVALKEGLALGLDRLHGIGVNSEARCKHTLGGGLNQSA